jgi:hypothetical protein
MAVDLDLQYICRITSAIGNAFIFEAPRLRRLNESALYAVGAFAREHFEKAKIVITRIQGLIELRSVEDLVLRSVEIVEFQLGSV